MDELVLRIGVAVLVVSFSLWGALSVSILVGRARYERRLRIGTATPSERETRRLLLDDLHSRMYRSRDLAWLLLLAPLDLVLYRPIIFWARWKGSWRFLRGDKSWHRFERNVRSSTA